MGNMLGGPISESDKAALEEKLQEIMVSFAKTFAYRFTCTLVQSTKDDLKAAVEAAGGGKKLPEPTKPAFIIKEGELLKSAPLPTGGFNKRYFRQLNYNDQHQLEYWTANPEDDKAAKLKGTINLCPMRARKISPADKLILEGCGKKGPEYEHGVVLEPWSSWDTQGRKWYLMCKDDEEAKDWYGVLSSACYRAQAPVDKKSPICAVAFKQTIKDLSWEFRLYERYDQYNPEEALQRFIFQVISRNCMSGIYENCGNSSTMRNLADGMVGTMIGAATKPAWVSASSSAEATVNTIKDQIKSGMEPLCQAEAKLLNEVETAVSNTLGDKLSELMLKLFPNAMGAMAKPVGQAMTETIKGWNAYMLKEVMPKIGSADAKAINSLETKVARQTCWSWSGPLREAFESAHLIVDICGKDAGFGSGAYTAYCIVREQIETFYQAATQEFFRNARLEGADHEKNLAEVLGKMIADHPEYVYDAYFNCFGDTLRESTMWREMVENPVVTITDPIKKTVDAIPVVNVLIDFEGIVDGCLEAMLTGCMKPTIEAATAQSSFDKDALIKELGADASAAA